MDTRWRRGLSRILDRMPSNLCYLAASQEFVVHRTTWEEALGAREEGKQQRRPYSRAQPQGLGTVCRCLGSTVSAQHRGKWLSLRVWGLRCAENFPSLTRWLSVFLSAFLPQLSKEGRGVQGPSRGLVYTTVTL